jgi:hypothetical protein
MQDSDFIRGKITHHAKFFTRAGHPVFAQAYNGTWPRYNGT